MIVLLRLLLERIRDRLRSRAALENEVALWKAENALLRRQLEIMVRGGKRRVRFTRTDRALFAWFCRVPSLRRALVLVTPQTVMRWHRMGFRLWWRWKSKARGGRPRVSRALRELIARMSFENPLWGAPRIHGELLKLGFEIAQATVSKYMTRPPPRDAQSWKTFLRNHAADIAAIDMLTVRTLAFECLYAFIVLGHGRRAILHVEVTGHPTALWLARQIVEAFPWDTAPRFLVRDNDGAYGEAFRSRVEGMGILDRPTAPHSPWQNGHVERLIGSIRRECLDHVIVLGRSHLRRVLLAYADYYNHDRTHLALRKDAPRFRAVEADGDIVSRPILGGLHHRYTRIPRG
jgi:transposase InsO family protein